MLTWITYLINQSETSSNDGIIDIDLTIYFMRRVEEVKPYRV